MNEPSNDPIQTSYRSYLTLIPNQIPYLRSGSQPILGFGGFGVIAAAERRSCSFRRARVAYRISEVSRNVEARWVHFSFRVPGLLDFHVIHVTVTVVVIPSLSVVKSLLYATLNPNDRLSECHNLGRRSTQDCLFYSTPNFNRARWGPTFSNMENMTWISLDTWSPWGWFRFCVRLEACATAIRPFFSMCICGLLSWFVMFSFWFHYLHLFPLSASKGHLQ